MIGFLNFFDYYVGNFFRRLLGRRTKDVQYRRLLRKILKKGEIVSTPQGEDAITLLSEKMRFDMRNGVPIITERDVLTSASKNGLSGVNAAIAELTAFMNGATTNDELKKFGCNWWGRWTTKEYLEHCELDLPEGSLGPGSYGAGYHHFPTAEGAPFNQLKNVIEQIKELPYLRTHVITTWIPQYQFRGEGKKRQVAVAPCHGSFLRFFINADKGEISLHHVQRSGDVPVGVVWNMIQYSAFLFMVAQVTGYRAKEYIHEISDAHIYVSQVKDVKELLKTRIGKFPDLVIDHGVEDIYDFRHNHFDVVGYEPKAERRKIWTPT